MNLKNEVICNDTQIELMNTIISILEKHKTITMIQIMEITKQSAEDIQYAISALLEYKQDTTYHNDVLFKP